MNEWHGHVLFKDEDIIKVIEFKNYFDRFYMNNGNPDPLRKWIKRGSGAISFSNLGNIRVYTDPRGLFNRSETVRLCQGRQAIRQMIEDKKGLRFEFATNLGMFICKIEFHKPPNEIKSQISALYD